MIVYNFLFDALEQFEIYNIFKLCFVCITNIFFTQIFCIAIIFLFILAATSNIRLSFYNLEDREDYFSSDSFAFFFWILSSLWELVMGILKDNVLQSKQVNAGFVFFLFLVLLFCNSMGLFPFTFTVTSSFVVTLFLSLCVFLAVNIMGLYLNGFTLFAHFLPTGTPLFIAPLLILIEIIPYFSRIFSLSIRLFANMLSGHGLLKILIGFSFLALSSMNFWFYFGIIPWIVVSIVFALEIAISFLQAYVFIILTSIYINDAIATH